MEGGREGEMYERGKDGEGGGTERGRDREKRERGERGEKGQIDRQGRQTGKETKRYRDIHRNRGRTQGKCRCFKEERAEENGN